MIDWLSKLPDGALGIALAASAWFGFNYAVLGERAMERDVAGPALTACVEHIVGAQQQVVPHSGIGDLLGMPELDDLEAALVDRIAPPALSRAGVAAQCACAIASAPRLRFDYALHTATFRLVPVDSAALFREEALKAATSPICSRGEQGR